MIKFRMWRVQAQLTCTTADGWESTRQCRTMDIASPGGHVAVRAVSDMAWDMSGTAARRDTRHTFATVVEIDSRGYAIGSPTWVRVSYLTSGIATVTGVAYHDVKLGEDQGKGNRHGHR